HQVQILQSRFWCRNQVCSWRFYNSATDGCALFLDKRERPSQRMMLVTSKIQPIDRNPDWYMERDCAIGASSRAIHLAKKPPKALARENPMGTRPIHIP